MSTLKVEVATIDAIHPHPNADRLELATVFGWNCVVPKGVYKTGDVCVYIPIDSVLNAELTHLLFKDSKIQPKNGRIRTIKIRGAISQGLVANPATLGIDAPVGTDVRESLGITKYEPPAVPAKLAGNQTSKRESNPNFFKYSSLENFKNYNKIFQPGDHVIVSEKIHGTNFRAGFVPSSPTSWWGRLKRWGLRKAGFSTHEFVYGSRNLQLKNGDLKEQNTVYARIVSKYDLQETLSEGIVVYGEAYGPGIQKGYGYGVKEGDYNLAVFDVQKDGKYLDYKDMRAFCRMAGLPTAPLLYEGSFDEAKVKALTKGPSVVCPEEKVREGVVIRSPKEENCYIGRKMLKLINDDYLLKDQSDFH